MPGPRARFTWVTAPKGHLCHVNKCQENAVNNRLCPEHEAMWMTQNYLPAMPAYGEPSTNLLKELDEQTREARRALQTVSGFPGRDFSDVAELRARAAEARAVAEGLRDSKHSSIRPILEAAAKLKRHHDQAIKHYSDVAELAELRAKVLEERLSMRPQALRPPALPSDARRRAK